MPTTSSQLSNLEYSDTSASYFQSQIDEGKIEDFDIIKFRKAYKGRLRYTGNIRTHSGSDISGVIESYPFDINWKENRNQNNYSNKLVIDSLQEIKTLLINHDTTSATKEQVYRHDLKVQNAINLNAEQIQNSIKELQSYVERFSVSYRLTRIALVGLLTSLIMFIIISLGYQIVIKSPVPEYSMLLAIFFYFIGKNLK